MQHVSFRILGFADLTSNHNVSFLTTEATVILPNTYVEIAISQKLLNCSQSSTALWHGHYFMLSSNLIFFTDTSLNRKFFILAATKDNCELYINNHTIPFFIIQLQIFKNSKDYEFCFGSYLDFYWFCIKNVQFSALHIRKTNISFIIRNNTKLLVKNKYFHILYALNTLTFTSLKQLTSTFQRIKEKPHKKPTLSNDYKKVFQ